MSDRREYKVIAIDFDGTIFETEYPKILRPILPVIEMAKTRKAAGDKLILWTCREGPELDAAVEACRGYGLEFDAVNDNLPELKEQWGNNPRKVAADYYIDDKNLVFEPVYYGNDTAPENEEMQFLNGKGIVFMTFPSVPDMSARWRERNA